jgi:hypothetical protein
MKVLLVLSALAASAYAQWWVCIIIVIGRRRRLNLANRPCRTATCLMAIIDTAVAGSTITRLRTSSARRLVTFYYIIPYIPPCASLVTGEANNDLWCNVGSALQLAGERMYPEGALRGLFHAP